MNGSDDELREHFQALREADLAHMPPFAELARRPANLRVPGRPRAPWVLAGGVGALALASVLMVFVQRRQEVALRAAAAGIARWQPPTDALLRFSDRGLFDNEPAAFSASVLDSIIPMPRED